MEIQHGFRTFPSSDIQPQGGVREIQVLSYHGWNDVGTLLVLDTILSILHTILSCWASCIQRKDHTSFFCREACSSCTCQPFAVNHLYDTDSISNLDIFPTDPQKAAVYSPLEGILFRGTFSQWLEF